MSRYVAVPGRPRADWEDQEPVLPQIQVYEPEDGGSVDTGLLDANGVKLYRVPARLPFGFVGG